MRRLLTSLFTIVAVWGVASAARADTPGRHPMYLHALTDLRQARATRAPIELSAARRGLG